MKSLTLNTVTFLFFILILINANMLFSQAKNTSFETLNNTCKGIKRADRISITVTRFSVSSRAAQATGQFGEELTAMLTNAIQQTNCFRVLQSVSKKGDWESEIGYNESGATNGSGPQRGNQMGAQAIVTAEITEYNEGKSSAGAFGVSVGSTKAKLGIILQVLDPETREMLWSEAINGEAKKNGFNGASILGVNLAGSNKLSEAMSSAVEDLLFKAVEKLVTEKDEILSEIEPIAQKTSQKSWNASNCNLLNYKNLRVMVIVPEVHIQRPIPDPAGETEILRKLIESGFRAIDPVVYATVRNGASFKDAIKDPMAAAALGKKFGADILIYGEGFSQMVSSDINTVTCRARVEVKAVMTATGEMIATNGMQAGGQDIAESTSAKTALKNAGAMIGDYLLEQFCTKSINFVPNTLTPSLSSPKGISASRINSSNVTIELTNVNFSKFNTVVNTLKTNSKVKEMISKELANDKGTIIVSQNGSEDDLAILISNLGADYEVVGVESGKISVVINKAK
jgi:curli biogenesis system outer membrane secretion channel CsgG